MNRLAAVLNAHAANELREKEFLKNTISDISHQLKTPLAALNIYNGLLQGEAEGMPEIQEFAALLDELEGMCGVKQAFGRRSSFDVPAKINLESEQADTVDLISYDIFDLECLVKDKQLRNGSDISKVYGNSNYVLAICDTDSF